MATGSWRGEYLPSPAFKTCSVLDRIDRELHSLERLLLEFDSSLEFFDKIPIRILLDMLFGVFRFSKASLYALASSFMTF